MRILGIAGSLRSGSYNMALLREAQELLPPGVELEIHDLRGLPFFDADVEAAGDPPSVQAFKDAIRSADALLIATPEYNRGVPGVLKNAIDWASRKPFASPLTGKRVAIIGAGGRSGTAKAQAQLRDALGFPRADVIDEHLLVPLAWEHVDEEGDWSDDVRQGLRRVLHALHASVAEPVAA